MSFGIILAALLVSGGQQNHAVQFLERPARFHEADRQIIQQLGMTGRIAPYAEITWTAHDSGSEVVQPYAIDDHTRVQRVIFRSDGMRQLQPSASLMERRRITSR